MQNQPSRPKETNKCAKCAPNLKIQILASRHRDRLGPKVPRSGLPAIAGGTHALQVSLTPMAGSTLARSGHKSGRFFTLNADARHIFRDPRRVGQHKCVVTVQRLAVANQPRTQICPKYRPVPRGASVSEFQLAFARVHFFFTSSQAFKIKANKQTYSSAVACGCRLESLANASIHDQ